MRKHVFLLLSVGMLIFMAVTTEKKVLITKGYAISQEELALGRSVYQHACRGCHQRGTHGAPAVDSGQGWEGNLADGIEPLLRQGVPECWIDHLGETQGDENPLSLREIEAAIAFMISRGNR